MSSRKDHKSTGKNHSGKDRYERQLDDDGARACMALTVFAKEIAWAELEYRKGFAGVSGLLIENAADKLIRTVKDTIPSHTLIEVSHGTGPGGPEVAVRYIGKGLSITFEKPPRSK